MSSASADDACGAPFSVPRVLGIVVPLIVIGAVAVQYVDLYLASHGVLSRGGPAINSQVYSEAALGLFVPALVLFGAVPWLRRRWRLSRGELVVIFSCLILALPLYGKSFWHHFPPLLYEYHRTRDLDRAMSISPHLWPNRGNLLEGASIEDAAETRGAGIHWAVHPAEAVSLVETPLGDGPAVRVTHAQDDDVTELVLRLDRTGAPRFPRPNVRYALYGRVRLDDPAPATAVSLRAGSAGDRLAELTTVRQATEVGVLAPDRFEIHGTIDYLVPRTVRDRFVVKWRFAGRGTFWLRDVGMIDTEETSRYQEGYRQAEPDVHAKLDDGDRAVTRLRSASDATVTRVRQSLFGAVNWEAWRQPLMAWAIVVAALFLGMFCLVALFVPHWQRTDRLPFPMQTFILDLTREDEDGPLAILRVKPFWFGVAVAAAVVLLQSGMIFPPVSLAWKLHEMLPAGALHDAWRERAYAPGVEISLAPLFLAVFFFVNLDLLRSIVVFCLGLWVFRAVGHFTPLRTLSPAGVHETPGFPFSHLISAGGFLFLVLFTIVSARRQLARAVRMVWGGRSSERRPGEVGLYRAVGAGLAATVVLFILFANLAGLDPWFVCGYLGVTLLVALTMARVRGEAGVPIGGLFHPYPTKVMLAIGGTLWFGFREVTFTAQSFFMYMGGFLLTAPILAESLSAASRVGVSWRKVATCLGATFAAAMVVGGVVSLSWAYTVGAMNMNLTIADKRHEYNRMTLVQEGDDMKIQAHFAARPETERLLTPRNAAAIDRPEPTTVVIMGISFGITALLALARAVWLGFPLHPMGFVLAASPGIHAWWGSVLAAWIVKSLSLRFGGLIFVRQWMRPFFVGIFFSTLLTLLAVQVIRAATMIPRK